MLNEIRSAVKAKGHSWNAGKTSVSDLSLELKRRHLGLIKVEAEKPEKLEAVKLLGHAAAVDWRKNPNDFTTKIKDQGACGACVAFGTCATVEANKKIADKNAAEDIDLSEADLFFRKGGASCAGWYFEPALRICRDQGVCAEACDPYPDGPVQPCASQVVAKIASYTKLSSNDSVKDWVANYGPVVAGLDIYEDFFYYTGGVYRNSYGAFIGGHAICLVGYDDAQGCWIGKNSWGTEWGENGWLKIGYNDCGMLSEYAAYGLAMSGGPVPPIPPVSEPDLKVTKDGTFYITLTATKGAEATLVLNGKEMWPISSMVLKIPKTLGSFKAGDGLKFELKTNAGTIHKVQIFPTGWRVWQLRMGITPATNQDFTFTLEEK